MDPGSETAGAPGEYAGLHFIDGTSSQLSYAVVARRGHIFLGVRSLGLADGDQFGVPGKTYLHAWVGSARDEALADKLDLESSADNVINLFQPQLALDEAWPGFTFEKIDGERASLILGMFIGGSLVDDTNAVIKRIEEASLLRKLVDCVIDQAGPGHSIARAKLVAAWMFDQAKPRLTGLKKAAEHQKIVLAAQKEFAELVDGQVEVVGPHLQQLDTIYHKYHLWDGPSGFLPKFRPEPLNGRIAPTLVDQRSRAVCSEADMRGTR